MEDQKQQEQLNWKLFLAAKNGKLGEVKQLVSKGANVNCAGWVCRLHF
jgi:hypothetical protein